jgi:hypothetical protein
MIDSCPTVTLYLSAAHMSAISRRLTTYLLQEHLAFVQTFYAEQQTEFTIFYPQGDPVVHLLLHTPESIPPVELAATFTVDLSRAGEISPLLQRLLEVCKPADTSELHRNQHHQAEQHNNDV